MSNHSSSGLTFVILAYNKEDGIVDTITRVISTLSSLDILYELIVVNDGSNDSTVDLIAGIGRISVILHPINTKVIDSNQMLLSVLAQESCFQHLKFSSPKAEKLRDATLYLPMHSVMSEGDVDRISAAVRDYQAQTIEPSNATAQSGKVA